MRRCWIFFLFFTSLYADDHPEKNPVSEVVKQFDTEPSSMVGKVNVITGSYQEFSQDIVIPGPEPLSLQRAFSNLHRSDSGIHDGWALNHNGYFGLGKRKFCSGTLVGAFGSSHKFSGGKKVKTGLNPLGFNTPLWYTNTTSGRISGRTDLRNQLLQANIQDEQTISTPGDGSCAFYEITHGINSKKDNQWYCNEHSQLIRWEKKPNGNKILYEYDHHNRLKKIAATSATGTEFSHIVFGYPSSDQFSAHPEYNVDCSDGRKVHYEFIYEEKGGYFLKKVERPEGPIEKYEYCNLQKGVELLTKKILPDDRFLQTHYFHKGHLYKSPQGDFVKVHKDDFFIGRVCGQLAPLGTTQEPVWMNRFYYYFNDNKRPDIVKPGYITDALDALEHKTRYHISINSMLNSISPYTSNGQVYRVEKFFWATPYLHEGGNLICRTIERPDGVILGGKAYKYDIYHNVIKETLFGNLTGTNPVNPALEQTGYPKANGCHRYEIDYKYSNDGKNLLLEEIYPNGKQVKYSYHPGTDLNTCRLTCEGERIALREFFIYDGNAVMIQSIRDDGSQADSGSLAGVTERIIIRSQPKATSPCLGLPEVVTESCLDLTTGKEILIKKLKNNYDNYGHLTQQDHFDSQNAFTYSLKWDYDDLGRLSKETNALGEVTTRFYNKNWEVVHEQGPDARFHKSFGHDFMGRLIVDAIVQSKDLQFVTSYGYDKLGNRTSMIDGYGNKTEYVYDEFSRLTSVMQPAVIDADGKVSFPTTRYGYDHLGYCTSTTDPRAMTTTKEYNLRGQPLAIRYPDGSAEYISYTLDGKVEDVVEKTGNVTHHEYDFLGRLIMKKTFSPSMHPLLETTATYDAFHLRSEIDAGGVETQYTYDPVGRLSSKTSGNARTTYHYDTLGRLQETRDWLNDTQYNAKIQLYDFLNRIVEERLEDEQGTVFHKTCFGYDANGKQSTIRQEGQDGLALTTTTYDVFGRPATSIDAEGNKTTTEYKTIKNALGQNVLQAIQTDPLGNLTITTYDALNRVSTVVCKNAFAQKTRDQQVFYDLGNNKNRHVETVITPDQPDRQVITLCEYDYANHLIHFVEGFGSPDEKHTRWTYDKAGRKEKMIKSDGTEVVHAYNDDGLLRSLQAHSSIHYAYHYNKQQLPIEIENMITHTKTTRTYDDSGRLIQEILGNGISIVYTYDPLGRPLTITLPDQSGIAYSYHGPYLHTVKRLTPDGETKYLHTYAEHDLGGSILKEELINGVLLEHTYDKLGRQIDNHASQWHESDIKYDAMGNLLKREISDSQGKTPYTYTYDSLYQIQHETGHRNHRYKHDSLYNRVEKDDKQCQVNSLNQLLSNSIKYNSNGNLIRKGNITYEYDALDRLIQVNTPDNTVSYTYDAFNRRLTKTLQEGDVIHYLYLGQNEIGSQVNGKMKDLRILGVGKGAEIGAAISLEIDDDLYVPLHDHNGNVAALLDSEGNIVQSYRYTSFGEEKTQFKPISPWRFSSKRVDPETGLIHFGRRYYDPDSAQWTTPDPIGPESGPNLYTYALNNPLTHFDTYGLFSLGDLFRGIFFCIGWLIETISYEGIPCIPALRDVFMATGHILSGKSPQEFIPSYREPHSSSGSAGGDDDKTKAAYYYLNGVKTPEDEVKERAEQISKDLNGRKVHYVYNATHGFATDFLEWVAQRLGIPTHSVKIMTEDFRKQWRQNPGREICLEPHSQGGEIGACLKSTLTREELSLIEVNTFGSANLFEKGHFAKVTHYVSTRDWVPLLANPIQYLKAVFGFRPDVVFLPALSRGFMDHAYANPTYSQKSREIHNNLNTR